MILPRGTLGFTGTSKGMTPRQLKAVRRLLYHCNVIHLGDCVGADAEAYEEAMLLGIATVGHPPSDGKKRAFLDYNEEWAPQPYLVRNRDIVGSGIDGLIAAPDGWVEEQRSGTWAHHSRGAKEPPSHLDRAARWYGEGGAAMTQEQTIRYLCRIKALVWRSIDPAGRTASDCVCADQSLSTELIRDEGLALDWMLEAVVQRLDGGCYTMALDAFDEVTNYRGRALPVPGETNIVRTLGDEGRIIG